MSGFVHNVFLIAAALTRRQAGRLRRRSWLSRRRRHEVFASQFDGAEHGRSAAAACWTYGAVENLESRAMMTASASEDFVFWNGEVTKYVGAGGDVVIPATIGGQTVRSISAFAFYGCGSMTSVTLPQSVQRIGQAAFASCSSLNSITLPAGVKSLDAWVFSDCKSLQTVTLPAGLTSIGKNAFLRCGSLSGITLPAGVTSIEESAFADCSRLTSIAFPAGVTSIGDAVLKGCVSLTLITLPAGVTSISANAFAGCTSLATFAVPSGVTSIGTSAFRDCTSLTDVTLPESLRTVESAAFLNCTNLSSITIPSGVTSVGASAFLGCRSLASIELPSGVTGLEPELFSGCSRLASVVLASGTTSIGALAFADCTSLTKVVIPAGCTSIGESAFLGCLALTDVPIPSSVASIESSAFLGCVSLRAVVLPAGLTRIFPSVFSGCYRLSSVSIPEGVASIGASAFAECKALTNVFVPGSVASIEDSAFAGCVKLTGVTLSSGVASLGESAFSGCISLADLVVPATVSRIGKSAFAGCAKLGIIDFLGDAPDVGLDAFQGTAAKCSVSYREGTLGWQTPFAGLPAKRVAVATAPVGVVGEPGDAKVSLKWKAPDDNGGMPITDYLIQFRTTDTDVWRTFLDQVSASTSATVTGLENDTPYVFRVSAGNFIGFGSPSVESAAVTPRKPGIVAASSVSSLRTTYGTPSDVSRLDVKGSFLKAPLVVTAPAGFELSSDNQSFAPKLSIQASGASLDATLFVRLAAKTAAGTYEGRIKVESVGAATVEVGIAQSIVLKKSLSVTGLTAQSKVYDGSLVARLAGTARYAGLVPGDSFSVKGTPTARFADKEAGVLKPVTIAGYLSPSSNYSVVQPVGLTASITPKPITVTADRQSKVYGDKDPFLAFSVPAGALLGMEKISGGLARDVGDDVGQYSIRQGTLTAGPNYTITYVGAEFSISPRPLTIIGLVGQPKVYDGLTVARVTGEAKLSGVVEKDDVVLAGAASSAFVTKDAGDARPIAISGFSLAGTKAPNYTLVPVVLSAAIAPAPIDVIAIDTVRPVNAGNPQLTATITGIVAGDTAEMVLKGAPALSTTASLKSPIGRYPIVVSRGTLTPKDGNYFIRGFVAGTLRVAARPGVPTGLVGSPGDGRVTLSWKPPVVAGEFPVTDYIVQYRLATTPAWSVFPDAVSTAENAVITGLSNGQKYVFRVMARSAVADSPQWSAVSAVVVPRDV